MFVIDDHPYFAELINGTDKNVDYEYERITSSYILIKGTPEKQARE